MSKSFNWTRTLKNICYSLIIPIGIFLIFAVLSKGRTATLRMFLTTLRQSIVPIIICWGMMMNMSIGMVNFSVGAMMVFAGIVGGGIAKMTGTGLVGLVVISFIVTLAAGAITGVLYNLMQVPAMVLTIGMLMIWESAPRLFFPNGVTLSSSYTILSKSPYVYIILIIMFIAFHLIFNKTTFGHNLRAIGNNQSIANSVGLNISRIKFLSYLIGAIFIAVAGILYVSEKAELRNVSSMQSMMIMMDGFLGMFMAMFLSKFSNMSIAVVIGVFSMRLLSNGFVAMGISSTARDVVQGLLLLVLLAISANAGLLEKRKADKEFVKEALLEATEGQESR